MLAVVATTFFGRAYADGTFSLTGTVPAVTNADVVWANPHIALGAMATAAASVQSVIAAFQVYSNDANGFTIKAAGLHAGGKLLGTVTAVSVPYKVALFSTYANAVGGTTFLAAPGTAGTNSSYTSPVILPSAILVSGTLTAPVDTGSVAPYWLGSWIAAVDAAGLMADSYTDTLAITIVGN